MMLIKPDLPASVSDFELPVGGTSISDTLAAKPSSASRRAHLGILHALQGRAWQHWASLIQSKSLPIKRIARENYDCCTFFVGIGVHLLSPKLLEKS